MPQKKIIFIVGPTAVGKTEISILLAKSIGGEVISCDSAQVYKEINIVSGKPDNRQLKEVKHHLLSLISVKNEFDVASYNKKAGEAIKMIHSEEKIPIIVGGSGLYMQILLDGIFEGVEKDVKLRNELELQAEEKGNKYLHEQLEAADPEAAMRVHPNDRRRIVRALEIFIKKNQPVDEIRKERKGIWGEYDITIFALNRDRSLLYDRINRRVDKMFEQGVVKEIQKIKGKDLSPTAAQLIGLEEIGGYLDGAYDEEQARYLMKLNTRHFAKRQLTWLRREERLTWVDIEESETNDQVAARLCKLIQ